MNEQDAARVLALAATFDMRMSPPTEADAAVRAGAWALALVHNMPPEWALQAVIDHYARSDTSVTPSMLNALWREQQRRSSQERERQERYESVGEGVPMPAEVRAYLRNLQQGHRRGEPENP